MNISKNNLYVLRWAAKKLRLNSDIIDWLTFMIEGGSDQDIKDGYEEKLSKKLAKYKEEYVEVPHDTKYGFAPRYIMLHHTYGGWSSLYHWLRNIRAKVSYHYAVNSNGQRRQFVWDSWTAWHAGTSSWKGLSGLNKYSFGLAWLNDTYKREPTFEEIDSMAELSIFLIKKMQTKYPKYFPKDRSLEDIIIRHEDAAPRRKKDCAPLWRTKLIERIKQREPNLN